MEPERYSPVRPLRPAVVAIDGPAASGKSTVGVALADVLGYLFFDTGVMYRAVTVAALEKSININDANAVGQLAETIVIDIASPRPDHTDGRLTTVLVDGIDVTPRIRTNDVDRAVSPVAVHERVRSALGSQQRRIAMAYGEGRLEKAGVVMVGRDIGTVVIPEAPVKIYLDATPEERARRRHKEIVEKGGDADYESVLNDVQRRDKIDSGREIAPLSIAEGAHVLDTTGLTPVEVITRLLVIVEEAASRQNKP